MNNPFSFEGAMKIIRDDAINRYGIDPYPEQDDNYAELLKKDAEAEAREVDQAVEDHQWEQHEKEKPNQILSWIQSSP